jgi:hypothetical protein
MSHVYELSQLCASAWVEVVLDALIDDVNTFCMACAGIQGMAHSHHQSVRHQVCSCARMY